MAVTKWISKTASEWIGGVKRFLHFPFSPKTRPTEDYHLVNKFWTIESDSCNKLVVSVSAHTVSVAPYVGPSENDIWVDMNRTQHVNVITADYTVLTTDLLLIADDTGGGFSIALPTVTISGHLYKELFITKRTGTATVYVRDGEEADCLVQKGAAGGITTTLKISTAMESMHLFNDGTYWYDVNANVSV